MRDRLHWLLIFHMVDLAAIVEEVCQLPSKLGELRKAVWPAFTESSLRVAIESPLPAAPGAQKCRGVPAVHPVAKGADSILEA